MRKLGCISLLTGMILTLSAAQDVPQAGQQVPEFTLPSQDGTDVSLKDFRGKYIVLYFYPKDNTPGCTVEAHNFQRDLPNSSPEFIIERGRQHGRDCSE
jgi:peroxiredoxin Q/BCP